MCDPNRNSQSSLIEASKFYKANVAKALTIVRSIENYCSTREEFVEEKTHSLCLKAIRNAKTELLAKSDPKIVILGKSNVGKSSIINQLFRDSSNGSDSSRIVKLPIAQTACSARITVLCAGNSLAAKVVNPASDNAVLQTVEYDNSPSAGKIINLDREERDLVEKINKHIHLHSPHPLLLSGLVVIDCPGFGEADVMDDIILDFLRGCKPVLIIYVIDGKNGYKENPDRKNLGFLTERLSQFDLLVCVNKLEYDAEAADQNDMSESDSEDDDEDRYNRLVKEAAALAEEQKKQVIKNLNTYHPTICCKENLVGISARCVERHRSSSCCDSESRNLLKAFIELESSISNHLIRAGTEVVSDLCHKASLTNDADDDEASSKTSWSVAEQLQVQIGLITAGVDTADSTESHTTLHNMRQHAKEISQSILRTIKNFPVDKVLQQLTGDDGELRPLCGLLSKADQLAEDFNSSNFTRDHRREEQHLLEGLFKNYTSEKDRILIRFLCSAKDALAQKSAQVIFWNFRIIFDAHEEASHNLELQRQLYKNSVEDLVRTVGPHHQPWSIMDKILVCMNSVADAMIIDNRDLQRICLAEFHESFRSCLTQCLVVPEFQALLTRSSRIPSDKMDLLHGFLGRIDFVRIIEKVIASLWNRILMQREAVDTLYETLDSCLQEKIQRSEMELENTLRHLDQLQSYYYVLQGFHSEVLFSSQFKFDSSLHVRTYDIQDTNTFSTEIVPVEARDTMSRIVCSDKPKPKEMKLKIYRKMVIENSKFGISIMNQLMDARKLLEEVMKKDSVALFWFTDNLSIYICVEDRFVTLHHILHSGLQSLSERLLACIGITTVVHESVKLGLAFGTFGPLTLLYVDTSENNDRTYILNPGCVASWEEYICSTEDSSCLPVPNYFCYPDLFAGKHHKPAARHDVYSLGILIWTVLTYENCQPLPKSLESVKNSDELLTLVKNQPYWIDTIDSISFPGCSPYIESLNEIIKDCLETTNENALNVVEKVSNLLTEWYNHTNFPV